ncbi:MULTISPECIES: GntR family transcriptional regulator [Aeromicrobium]|uniref:GntR family transcriptional regulator n=1 Tax=Aeromicrobium TaxID=2040 RepID=UPI000700FAC5|nr:MULTISPECIES: GntR family transcriptional regulator [Aeromicrobium]KQX72598.1 GntR family transcriptional regulator [Aeromicrobium sp. Root472D3]MBD8607655.1 GntR family transcriptional regulator [Aeromicrobium sp. CFBP 8757]MCL8252253.1 GntR family transcriptional regulator [Aeromicrobium fastidiosum]
MPGPAFTLDRSSPVPLYFQVAEQFERAILEGTIAPGERIDNEVALAQRLGLSRPTMRQAIQVLVDKGMLVRKRGVGTQVVHGKIRRSVELTSLHDDLSAAGQKPRTEVIAVGRVEADEDVARELQLTKGADVWSLERLRFVDRQPLAHMHNYLPVDVVDLDAIDLSETGLYAHLRASGIVMRVARQRIGARGASVDEARLLGERKGAPLLTMQRTAYDNAGRAVEYGRHAYRPDLYAFELTLVDR